MLLSAKEDSTGMFDALPQNYSEGRRRLQRRDTAPSGVAASSLWHGANSLLRHDFEEDSNFVEFAASESMGAGRIHWETIPAMVNLGKRTRRNG